MAEPKTRKNSASVSAFLNSIENERRRADAKAVHKMMREVTGKRAKMWGSGIVGYGSYDYTYANGQVHSWALCGFSPRKQNLVVYIMPGFKPYASLMAKLGKYKTGKSCLYLIKLEDVDQMVLRTLVDESIQPMREKYKVPR